MNVEILRKIETKKPVLLAGWPGMGHVGLRAVDYMRQKTGAKMFAKIDLSKYFSPDVVKIKNGVATLPKQPVCRFFYTEDPEIIILEGEAQLSGNAAAEVIFAVLDIALRYNVNQIYTGAAYASNLSSRNSSVVYGAANKSSLMEELEVYGVEALSDGQITGMNGTLIGFAARRSIDAACLLATMPIYAVTIPNPKSSLALVRVWEQILGAELDKTELENESRKMEENMGLIEEKIRSVSNTVLSDQEKEVLSEEEEQIPAYIMEKIEKLFGEAKKDKGKVDKLKQELDRWDLYEHYEDRFLDLFREE